MTIAVSWRLKLSKERFYLEILATSEKGKKNKLLFYFFPLLFILKQVNFNYGAKDMI